MSAQRDRRLKRMEDFLRCRLAEEIGLLAGRSESTPAPALTLSREAGARGLAIGEKLVDYLGQFDESSDPGWALFDKALVARVIEDHDLPDSLVDRLVEGNRSSLVEKLLGPHPSTWTLFHHTADTIRKLCAMGNVIVVGRGGNLVTEDLPNVFHVRLVGSPEVRMRNLARRLRVDEREAAHQRDQLDRAREDYVSRHLQRSIGDPTAYHLVLNTDRFSDELAARVIGDTLLEWRASGVPSNRGMNP